MIKAASMRILQVIHQFPPFSSQGSEVYCHDLSHALRTAGDRVGIFHISIVSPRRPHRLMQSVQDGLSLFHCVDGGEYSRLANWPNPFLQRAFQQTLRTYVPDVVHFHNYLSLGDDLVGLARASGSKVVYTLHDYGLLCPNALLLRNGTSLCEKASPDFFEGCCPTLIRTGHGHTPHLAARLPALARWRQYAANQPGRLRRFLLQKGVAFAEQILGSPESTAIGEKKAFFLTATRRIFTNVDLFIAPSVFLRERYVACGIPSERIHHLRNGMRHFSLTHAQHRKDDRLQFGYIGAFHAHKGIDILLEAFRGLGDRATLHLHGSSFDSPVSEAYYKKATTDAGDGVIQHGRYNNTQIGTILAGLDAVIVPSRWYENSPLTIQEAQIAGVPVITAGVGGMAELVRDGIDGRHFRFGDPQDLRRLLISLIDDPDQLREMRARAPQVPTIEEQAHQLREHYYHLIFS